jgi:uncharacterized protein (TIGR03437 family)
VLTPKQQYLEFIRANSSYPTYRGFIGTIALLGYVLAALDGLAALIAGLGFMSRSLLGGLAILVGGGIFAALTFLLARFFREIALIVADFGDATIETNSRLRASSTALLCLVLLIAGAQRAHAQSSVFNTNLIVNGNAETGSAGTGIANVVPIPGWTRTGNVTVLPYNLTGYLLLSDPVPPDHGFQYFASQSGSSLAQVIDVSAGASTTSSGNVKFTASAYLGSDGGVSYPPQMSVAFQNASGQTFFSATVGPVSSPRPALTLQQQVGIVPSGTTRITVTVTFASTAYASFADSLSLVLAPIGTPAAALGANLIVNGGAEAGPNAAPDSPAGYVPGWSTRDGISVAPYGGAGWIATSSPGPPDRGVNLFCTVYGGGTMYQAAGQPVAPGSLVAIYGTNFASVSAAASAIPLSTTLAGLSVTFNGIAAPIVAVAPSVKAGSQMVDQINAIVPWNVPSGPVPVVVTRNQVASAPVNIQIAATSPGIFYIATDGAGVNRPLVYNNNDNTFSYPSGIFGSNLNSRPASISKDTVVLWCTGLGAVTATPSDGAPATNASGQFVESDTVVKPVVMVGGRQANVLFSGLTQYPSIYQVNISLDPGTPTGNAVPIQVQMNGVTTTDQLKIAVAN